MIDTIAKETAHVSPSLIKWRRDFHKYAESGWVEIRTASIVADKLSKWGFDVQAGQEVIKEDARMGVPDEHFLHQQEKRALSQGAIPEWVPKLTNGFTGVVGLLDTGRPGPTVGIRVDMDALDIQESFAADHVPKKGGFVSTNANMMHACGHDAHTTIGLGVAHVLSQMKDRLQGRIKLIFQPAEEGVRGALSMVEAGVVDDVDVFIAIHIGMGAKLGELVCADLQHLATTKFDVTFTGKAAHAGGSPQEGKNALLAAATASLNMHAISRHRAGKSRVNVGVLEAGSGRNIIPSTARLKVETRGETTAINDYMYEEAIRVVKAAAVMYDVEADITLMGQAQSSEPSEALLTYISEQAKHIADIHTISNARRSGGSEDATYMMTRVKERGGLAAYIVFGTTLAAGHHNERFDIDEKVMAIAVRTLALCVYNADQVTAEAAE